LDELLDQVIKIDYTPVNASALGDDIKLSAGNILELEMFLKE